MSLINTTIQLQIKLAMICANGTLEVRKIINMVKATEMPMMSSNSMTIDSCRMIGLEFSSYKRLQTIYVDLFIYFDKNEEMPKGSENQFLDIGYTLVKD